MTDKSPAPIVSAEGWHVLHLFYKVEQGAWSLLSKEEQFTARTRLSDLVAEIRGTEGAQVLTFAMVSPKADLGFMLLCADLHTANFFEKRLTNVLGPCDTLPTDVEIRDGGACGPDQDGVTDCCLAADLTTRVCPAVPPVPTT